MEAVSYANSAKQAQRIKKFIENPDSTSGVVTVPKVIASGETITIPAGRIAILPNVQIDGVLNVEGEVFIPSGATLGDLDAQLALKADTSYVNAQLSLKANTADLKEIGVGQTWQNVTASRIRNVTYYNTTGKPITITARLAATSSGDEVIIRVNGIDVVSSFMGSVLPNTSMTTIIPVNGNYMLTGSGTNIIVLFVFELR